MRKNAVLPIYSEVIADTTMTDVFIVNQFPQTNQKTNKKRKVTLSPTSENTVISSPTTGSFSYNSNDTTCQASGDNSKDSETLTIATLQKSNVDGHGSLENNNNELRAPSQQMLRTSSPVESPAVGLEVISTTTTASLNHPQFDCIKVALSQDENNHLSVTELKQVGTTNELCRLLREKRFKDAETIIPNMMQSDLDNVDVYGDTAIHIAFSLWNNMK